MMNRIIRWFKLRWLDYKITRNIKRLVKPNPMPGKEDFTTGVNTMTAAADAGKTLSEAVEKTLETFKKLGEEMNNALVNELATKLTIIGLYEASEAVIKKGLPNRVYTSTKAYDLAVKIFSGVPVQSSKLLDTAGSDIMLSWADDVNVQFFNKIKINAATH